MVCSGNKGRPAPFIEEQAEALRESGISVEFFLVRGQGVFGYLGNLFRLRKQIRIVRPAVVHAHYGLTGLLACLQRLVPVVTTYHGSDVNNPRTRLLSLLAMRLSARNIFVSEKLSAFAGSPKRSTVIPCGIDTRFFTPMRMADARASLGFGQDSPLVLFAGSFQVPVKNPTLARAAAARVPGARLVELAGYSRDEVRLLLNACNVLLMTSHTEGSPQIVKEALACNCPVVSTDVGDVRERIIGLPGCSITGYRESEIAECLVAAIETGRAAGARERILTLDNREIARRIIEVYHHTT